MDALLHASWFPCPGRSFFVYPTKKEAKKGTAVEKWLQCLRSVPHLPPRKTGRAHPDQENYPCERSYGDDYPELYIIGNGIEVITHFQGTCFRAMINGGKAGKGIKSGKRGAMLKGGKSPYLPSQLENSRYFP